MLEPQHHRTRMSNLWRRARAAGFSSPDNINGRPRDVDVSAEGFADIVSSRADISLEPLVELELTYRSPNTQARVSALTSTGAAQAVATTRPALGPIDIVLPSRASGTVAADVFLYTRDGDFGYANLLADVPASASSVDPLEEAVALVDELPDVHSVLAHPRGVRRLFQGERKRMRDSTRSLIASDPRLGPIAAALSEHHTEPRLAIVALRVNLRGLLREASRTDLRSPHAVLRSRESSEAEVQITLAALLAGLHMDAGIATADGHPLAVVKVEDQWALAGPRHAQPGRIEPLIPNSLPRQIETVSAPPAPAQVEAAPRCAWMSEFVL